MRRPKIARIDAQRAMSERQLQRIEQLANNSISQTQLDEVRSQLAMLTAQLQQAQVRHRSAKHDLEQTELRAPFSGVVTNVSHNAANTSPPAQPSRDSWTRFIWKLACKRRSLCSMP